MAPEMIKNTNYDYSVDWFSFGLVLFEMLSGRSPFKFGKDLSVATKMNRILGEQIQMPQYCSDEAIDLLTKLLRYEPSERIGCWQSGVDDIK